MEGKVDPVKSRSFKCRDLCRGEQGAVGLEGDDTHLLNLPERRDEFGKIRVHNRFTRRINMAFDPRSLEPCYFPYSFCQVLHLNFIAGGTRC